MKKVNLKGIGEVCFIKSKSANRLAIRMWPFKGVRVYVPQSCSMEGAKQFALEKKDWINRHKKKIEEMESAVTVFKPGTEFSTKFHKLSIEYHDKEMIRGIIGNGKMKVFIPKGLQPEEEQVQDAIRNIIERTLKIEANMHLRERTWLLAKKHNIGFNKLTVKNIISRWGSCSGKNNINLSIHLMRVPDHLIDYVILHELAHVKHKNHSKDFWGYLDQLTGGKAKKLDKELNNYSLRYY